MKGFEKLEKIDADWMDEMPDIDDQLLVFFWSSGCPHCHGIVDEMQEIARKTDLTPVGIHRNEYGFEKPDIRTTDDIHIGRDSGAWNDLGNDYRTSFVLLENLEPVAAGGLEEVLNHAESGFEPSETAETEEHYLGYRKGRGVNGRGSFMGENELGVPTHRPENEVFLDGRWRMNENHSEPLGDSKLYLKSRGSEFHISAEGTGHLKIYLDGQKPGERRGKDLADHRIYPEKGRSFEVVRNGNGLHELTVVPEGDVRLHSISVRKSLE